MPTVVQPFLFFFFLAYTIFGTENIDLGKKLTTLFLSLSKARTPEFDFKQSLLLSYFSLPSHQGLSIFSYAHQKEKKDRRRDFEKL